MCIAIVKPKDKEVSRATLFNCYTNNKDGCGFAYINTDDRGISRIKVKKAMDFESFYEKYTKAVSQNPHSPFLIHFRIKTHGQIDLANCHPFKIDREHVFIHNGTISGVDYSKDKSDTRMFKDQVLRVLPKNWNKNSGIKSLIEEFIGYSKLAVMDINGEVNIYNEKKGEWVDGVWYSNNSYKERKPYTPPKTNKSAGKNWWEKQWQKNTNTTQSKSTSRVVSTGNVPKKRYDEWSYIPCDHCGRYEKVNEMEAYLEGRQVMCFCQTCGNTSEAWNVVDVDELISPECHVDWLNQQQIYCDEKMYAHKGEWENPWAEVQNTQTVELPEDYEEMQEGAYALTLIQ